MRLSEAEIEPYAAGLNQAFPPRPATDYAACEPKKRDFGPLRGVSENKTSNFHP